MATHRPHDTGFAPDVAFQLALGVLEASEDLAARHRPITPNALARQLRARPSSMRPTVPQIQDALAQVQRWRDQILTRDLLQHRRQLVALCAHIEAEQQRLSEDWVYLTRMLRETDALLHHSLTTPSGPEPSAARATTGDPSALQ
ncbi:MAG TPA: hypothetical protein P5330_08145 [Candidatus Competibacteraceae bacterium]|nr:hypothetical protein [Candidatus Competibacteraceae bacterium]